MAKYLFSGSYTQEGLRGVIKDGGSKRLTVIEQLVASLGGSVEAFYYAFGEYDFFLIADFPSHVDTATASIMVHATGAVQGQVTVLLTPEEIDEATQKTVNYSPPGQ